MRLSHQATTFFALAAVLVASSIASAGGIGCPQSISSGNTVIVIGTDPSMPYYNQPLPASPVGVDSGPEWVAITLDGGRAYLTAEGSGNVDLIDILSNTVVPTPFLTGLGQVEKIVIRSATRAFITIEGDGPTLKAIDIDPGSATYNQVVASSPLGCSVEGEDQTPDLTRVYVTNERDGTVAVVSTSDFTEISPRIAVGSEPENLAINPAGTRAFVTNTGSGDVYVIGTDPADPSTYNQVIVPPSPIGVGRYPQGVAFLPSGAKAYVANLGDGTVSVIETTNYAVTTVLVGGTPYGVAAHPDGTRVYVTIGDSIAVIRTSDNHVDVYQLAGANALFGIAITPNGSFGYIANQLMH